MSFSTTAKQIIATVAPLLGTALGGPFGGVAGTFLASKLGTAPGDQTALETKVLSGDPQVMLQIKQANDAFKAHLSDIGVQEEQIAAADTANARGREIAIKDKTPAVLVYLTTTGFFASLLGAFLVAIPESSKGIVYSMIGSLGTVWITQMGYYFGSSMGSDHKTDILATVSAVAAAKTK